MLALSEIPFFSSLNTDSLNQLSGVSPIVEFLQGQAIVRQGDAGKHFYAIGDGAVWVQTNQPSSTRNRGVLLGPGQVFGEMSLFSGAPVSNTLVATKDTSVYRIEGPEFLSLLEREPSLHRNLTKILIERLRKQSRAESAFPNLIVLTHQHRSEKCNQLVRTLTKAIIHYAGGTDVLSPESSTLKDIEYPALSSRILRWRESAPGNQFLILKVRPHDLHDMQDVLEPKDVILQLSDVTESHEDTHLIRIRSGVADFARIFIGEPTAGEPTPWAYKVSPEELEKSVIDNERWQPSKHPTLSRVARFATHKEIGITMSSGAARGFAHLGVLEVIERAGIPIDVMCGSSMGGIVGLTMAKFGNVPDTINQVRNMLGANKKIRDAVLFPRGSLFSGAKVASAAKNTFGDCTFADLKLPVSVVSADISAGERVILDRGKVAPAVLATSSIPGFFPPINHFNRFLVDGGVVSWVPLDVLEHRRCGIRIAINVLPLNQDSPADVETGFKRLAERLKRPLGLKSVLSASWELLGSWGSTRETKNAEVVITPNTPSRAGYDFDKFDDLVECGRAATEPRIEPIKELIEQMLQG